MQPLATKLVLQKKKAKEGRSGDEVEHFPVPSRVTVRRRESVSVEELNDPGGTSSHHNVHFYLQVFSVAFSVTGYNGPSFLLFI